MHSAALITEEHARSVFGLAQIRTRAVFGPCGAKFARPQAAVPRKSRNFIRIDLNAFVVTALQATVTDVTKALTSRIARRRLDVHDHSGHRRVGSSEIATLVCYVEYATLPSCGPPSGFHTLCGRKPVRRLQATSSVCCDAHSTSELGHPRPMHSAPVPINVRCYSNSDIIVRRIEMQHAQTQSASRGRCEMRSNVLVRRLR